MLDLVNYKLNDVFVKTMTSTKSNFSVKINIGVQLREVKRCDNAGLKQNVYMKEGSSSRK